jgi:hypothetical protein
MSRPETRLACHGRGTEVKSHSCLGARMLRRADRLGCQRISGSRPLLYRLRRPCRFCTGLTGHSGRVAPIINAAAVLTEYIYCQWARAIRGWPNVLLRPPVPHHSPVVGSRPGLTPHSRSSEGGAFMPRRSSKIKARRRQGSAFVPRQDGDSFRQPAPRCRPSSWTPSRRRAGRRKSPIRSPMPATAKATPRRGFAIQ